MVIIWMSGGSSVLRASRTRSYGLFPYPRCFGVAFTWRLLAFGVSSLAGTMQPGTSRWSQAAVASSNSELQGRLHSTSQRRWCNRM